MLYARAFAGAFTVLLASLFLAGAVQAQEDPSPAAPASPASLALEEARGLAGQQRYEEAVALARKWLKEEPKGPDADGFRIVLCHARTDGGIGPLDLSEIPVRVGGQVNRPELLHKQKAEYTEVARKARLQGVVIVELVVDQEGCVTQTKVIKGLPMGLDKAAQDAVSHYVFQPALFHDRPLSVYYVLTVPFALR